LSLSFSLSILSRLHLVAKLLNEFVMQREREREREKEREREESGEFQSV